MSASDPSRYVVMTPTYIPPTVFGSKFTCPHCAAIAHQNWNARSPDFGHYGDNSLNTIRTAQCSHCEKYTLWYIDDMVYPNIGNAPPPNSDMPDSVRKIYLEAGSIMNQSPRGAAGLLRLAIQVLCAELGEPGENINADIASLVQKGLPQPVQQSLDIVRVTGKNAVHPGQIDTDDINVVATLFGLLNVIVEYMIALPARVGRLYDSLPETSRDAIERRDTT